MIRVVIICYIVWNIICFVIMGVDKAKAKANAWRIPERVLLTVAFAMGAVGSIAGALVFRHKTRKPKFIIGLPLALCVNVALVVLLLKFFGDGLLQNLQICC